MTGRGHGRSTDPGRIDEAALVDDLARVIDTLDLTGVTLVAHSGAAVEALGYLAHHGSARIERLIMVAATGPLMRAGPDNPYGFPPEAIDELLHRLSHDLPAWIDESADPFAPGATRRTLDWLADMVLNTATGTLVDLQTLFANIDLRATAAGLDLPVTLLHGDLDVSAPLEITARRYAELIAGAELVVYEGVAHAVMVTHADRLTADIAERAVG